MVVWINHHPILAAPFSFDKNMSTIGAPVEIKLNANGKVLFYVFIYFLQKGAQLKTFVVSFMLAADIFDFSNASYC